MDERRVPADEIDVKILGCTVERFCDRDRALDGLALAFSLKRRVQQRSDGRHRNALIDDGDTKLFLHCLRLRHEVGRPGRDRLVDPAVHLLDIVGNAAPQVDAHGHRAYVQVLRLDHADSLQDLLDGIDHCQTLCMYLKMFSCCTVICTPSFLPMRAMVCCSLFRSWSVTSAMRIIVKRPWTMVWLKSSMFTSWSASALVMDAMIPEWSIPVTVMTARSLAIFKPH